MGNLTILQHGGHRHFRCGANAYSREGFQMAGMLKPQSYPFCAMMAAAPGETIAILQQRTIDEQGAAFGIMVARAKQEQRIKADRQLREEQDVAYIAALQIDKEKERIRPLGTPNHLPSGHVSRKDPTGKQIV